ncbi:MAG: tRNA pseudouridine(55) synthase TruB [Bacteroidota bacterium]
MDKPLGWTSHDVVEKLRRMFRMRKVGHAGTLDPGATGLLLMATGTMTKRLSALMNLEKEYVGTMVIGARTPSFDSETEVVERKDHSRVTEADLRDVFRTYVGEITQVPPLYSAVKHKGIPLYKYARKGEEVERRPRRVTISVLELVQFTPPEVRFRVVCSKGTYIRTLAEDIGRRLGCGAYLKSLIRTRVGSYSLEQALTIPELEALCARSRKAPL